MSAMKRKPVQQKSQIRWKRKVLAVLLVSLCMASLVLVETQYSRIVSLASLRHRFTGNPKIAFLFIARNRLPLDMIWDAFFKGEENRFSIYVHSRPGFLLNRGTTRSAIFLNRQVNDSIQVDWGEATMIEAERILLRHALTDRYNERFVFVSDSCIPIYNFSYMYDYIMSTPTSFVDSFADTKEGRYNPKMDPVIPVYNWRKGSQWVVLTRKHAEVVVNDTTVFPMFQQHCKASCIYDCWPFYYFKKIVVFEHNCIPDEHYVQTLLAQEGFEGEITRRSLIYSAWDLSASKDRERRGWHPVTYKFSDATPELIKSIKDIDNIYYETENRREWCSSKGKPAPCFLFARKFTRPAALHLLNLSLLGARRGAKGEA
ncbi:Core-2/I-branching beta-1,6-N-acetylglucosaminyltransferase family protein isoform 2 [Hibiscus syriacus]|uniref:Core-2/I-branching beta-1,6-N-acetylglucosaminyltransferase family protein isoform 2 n=1 Tax=Hibiscus syriacus TaxID=106335 RepID=A0A6A2ZC78_HIBSY|nr:Core-2/I-branching beta-1,6-N-acetylglucosaminyltransferase family protein isoform 2 [Hibiscus syriacus]